MGWTRRSVGVSLLLAMEAHRKAAGLRVVQLREARDWTQEDLAHAAELSVKTISRFENGRHDGRRTTVDRIATALGVQKAVIEGEPPAPLGLGENGTQDQLDRIEMMLELVVKHLGLEDAKQAATKRALDAAERTRARAQLQAGRTDPPGRRPGSSGR